MINQIRILSADITRIIAIMGAIAIHITFPFYGRWDFIGGKIWWIADIWNAFSRTSIPLFILISGYFLLNKEETIIQTWKRTFRRIIIPLISWSMLYLIWDGLYLHHGFNWQDIPLSLFHGGLFHYYFLGIMVGLYALIPIFKRMLDTFPKPLISYLIYLCLFGALLLNFYLYLTNKVFAHNIFTAWLLYSVYFLIGGLYKRHQITIPTKKLSLIFILYWIFTSLAGWLNLNLIQYETRMLYPLGSLSPYFDHYLSPNVMIMSCSLFLLIMQLPWQKIINKAWQKRSVKTLAAASFGMYLVHPFVIDFMHLKYLVLIENLWLLFILKVVSTYALSFSLSYLLARIPGIRKILGI